MCGRLNVIDDPAVRALCEQLEIDLYPAEGMIFKRFIRATDKVSIIRQTGQQRRVDNATWWLLLDATEQGFKPSKYTSFNTRYDKLNVPRSAGYQAYRHSRCIIPAKGFGETKFTNGKPQHYHDLTALDGEALAMGGLCREWVNRHTGETALSCSVITLPSHPKLQAIHEKASPLILPQHDDTLAMWLDPGVTDVSVFSALLAPHLAQDLIVQQIDKPSTYNGMSEPFIISRD